MAETFLFSIAEQILGKLASATFQQIGLAVGVNRDLEKLGGIIRNVKAVLLDAEEKQSTNRQLSLWLESLKDVCYDADDVLDEFAYEALRRQVVTTDRGSLKTKVSSFFLHSHLKFRFVMGSKIKEIRERLDEIAAHKAQFHLTEREVDRYVVIRDETHSFVHSSDVIGRDTDTENIVELLTLQDIDHSLSVVPIVGMGGLGKTTVAKLVYNDERVKDCFQLKMWVCVSDDFNLARLTKAIIEAATSNKCSDLSIDLLQTRLRDTLRDKKFLLVLDDVWNDNVEKWNPFRELLLGGVIGSKIVATTRSHSVASVMGTVPSYILKGLSDEDCWSLFVKCAFKEGQEKQHPNLERIGKEIVKKCHGVPLAVRSLGSMLFTKTEEREWISIKENEIWRLEQRENDILSALKLSYNHLPSYLKQCFAFCSIFPKDYRFMNNELVPMWMAQGFIQLSNESEEYEDIGDRYINELISRSFFQDIEEVGPFISFKMHDLIHDLALLVSQSECYTVSDSSSTHTRSSISNRVRHVSLFSESSSTNEVRRFLLGLNNLRTILFPIDREKATSNFFVDIFILRFKYIRMLDLRDSSFEVLPSYVGSLKHLRHLDLSNNTFMKKLPNSVCMLLHLQYLGLGGCSSLEELPSSVGSLKHLKHLDLYRNRNIKELPNSVCTLLHLQYLGLDECTSLEELPMDIGNLISLRTLVVTTTKQIILQRDKGIGSLSSLRSLYILGCPNLIELGQSMERLTSLQTLGFKGCDNIESLPCSVKHLSSLESLDIFYCEKLNSMEWEDDDIHDDLSRLMRLRFLRICVLPELKALPRWLQRVSNTLQLIHIISCRNLTTLPEWLQNLTSLQQLLIFGCPKLSALPEGMQRLTSLRVLTIKECPELSRRCKRETGKDWHKISHIAEIDLDDETDLCEDWYSTTSDEEEMALSED